MDAFLSLKYVFVIILQKDAVRKITKLVFLDKTFYPYYHILRV